MKTVLVPQFETVLSRHLPVTSSYPEEEKNRGKHKKRVTHRPSSYKLPLSVLTRRVNTRTPLKLYSRDRTIRRKILERFHLCTRDPKYDGSVIHSRTMWVTRGRSRVDVRSFNKEYREYSVCYTWHGVQSVVGRPFTRGIRDWGRCMMGGQNRLDIGPSRKGRTGH